MGLFRFILALSVLLNHLYNSFKLSFFDYQIVGGQVAVIGFFIVSGFYMSLILNEKYVNVKNPYFLFISNRFLRIFPLYWLVLILTIPVTTALKQIDIIRDTFNTPNIFFNIINFLQSIIQNTTLFLTVNSFIIIPKFYSNFYIASAWSLSVEVIFYMLAPFLVKGSLRKVFIIFLIAEALRIYLTHINFIYSIYSTPFLFIPNLPFFLLGGLSYQLYKRVKKYKFQPRLSWTIVIFMLFFTLGFSFIPPIFFFTFKQYVFYLLIVLSAPFLLLIEKKIKFSKFFGDLSYPIYISHLIILDIFNFFVITIFSKSLLIFLDLFVVLGFAYLLKKYISDPIDAYRAKRVKINKKSSKTKKSKLTFNKYRLKTIANYFTNSKT